MIEPTSNIRCDSLYSRMQVGSEGSKGSKGSACGMALRAMSIIVGCGMNVPLRVILRKH